MTQKISGKRIGLLFGRLDAGGIEQVMALLAREFSSYGNTVDVLVRDQSGPLAAKLPDKSTVFTLVPGNVVLGRILACLASGAAVVPVLRGVLPSRVRYAQSLRAYIREQSPDAIISAGIENNILAVTAKKLSGKSIRLVATEHGFKKYDRSLSRFYNHVDSVVCVSNSLRRHVANGACFGLEKLRTIYNPVELAAPEPDAPAPHPWLQPDQPPVVLYVGRLVPVKDLELLLRAFSLLRDERDVRMLIVGPAEETESGKRYASSLQALSEELDVAADVEFCGFSDNPSQFMMHAQVLAISSRAEGFGNVIVEALHNGCQVVSTDCGGPREILDSGRFGRIVPPGKADAFAQALAKALDDPIDTATLRERARVFAPSVAAEGYLHALFKSADAAVRN